MLTLIARLYKGLLQAGVSSTASICSAAADLNIAPTLVGFTTSSSTATLLASLHTSSTDLGFGLYIAQSVPLVKAKPVSFVSKSNDAVYTGIF